MTNKENNSKFVENIERYTIDELKKELKRINDVELLNEAQKMAVSSEIKEEIGNRIKEIELTWANRTSGKKGEKVEEMYKINISVTGIGGCGSKMAVEVAKKFKREYERFRFDYHLYDLDKEVYSRSAEIKNLIRDKPLVISPSTLGHGAGRVPQCSEVVWDKIKKIKSDVEAIGRGHIYIHTHSLGGGTGSRTCSLLIPKIAEEKGGSRGEATITFSFLTETDNTEKLNHIYTFPKVNKEADFVVLAENRVAQDLLYKGIIDEVEDPRDFINKKMADIIDLIISQRDPDKAYPTSHNFGDYLSLHRTFPEYREGTKRWLIPFLWPISNRHGDQELWKEYGITKIIMRALDEGCLCRINGEKDYKKCKACTLLIKSPDKKSFVKEELRLKETLGKILDIDPGNIMHTFISSNEFKLCLLLYGMPFMRLRELYNITDDDIRDGKESWKGWFERGIEELSGELSFEKDSNGKDTLIRDYKEKIDNWDPKEEFKKLRGDIL